MTTLKTATDFELNFIDQTLLNLALEEDFSFPWQDKTTEILFAHSNSPQQAKIISKQSEPITICGLPILQALIKKFDNHCQLQSHFQDGQRVIPHEPIVTLQGKAKTILMLERTLLNFFRHLSAIATLTHQYVTKVSHTHLKILDTRKTTPGFRHLEKYAVHCGGGTNHRMGLYDAIMIKDTHVDLLGGMVKTLSFLSAQKAQMPVIVEVRSIAELEQVIKHGVNKVTRVLFDNMAIAEMSEAVMMCQNIFETEASGNISLDNIVTIAETGVQYASIGKLTYGAGHVDLSMSCQSTS